MTGPGGYSRAQRKPRESRADGHEEASRPNMIGRVVRYVDRLVWLKQIQRDHQGLPPSALTVALTIVDHVDNHGEAFPSQPTMAEITGLNVRAIRRATDALAERGHLTIKVVRGRPTKNTAIQKSHNRYVPLWLSGTLQAPPSPDDGSENRTARAGFDAGKPDNLSMKTGQFEHENRTARAAYQTFDQTLRPDEPRESAPDGHVGLPDDVLGANSSEAARCRVEADSSGTQKVQPLWASTHDGVSDLADFDAAPAVADAHAVRRRREAEWRRLLQHDACITKLDAGVVHAIIDDGLATEAEVLAEIEALTRSKFRPRLWGGVRKFVLDEIVKRRPSTPRPTSAIERDPERPDDAIPVAGGFRTAAQFAEARRRWDDGFRWDAEQFGDPPDTEFTCVPPELRGPRKRRTAAVDRPVDTVQSDASSSTVTRGDFR